MTPGTMSFPKSNRVGCFRRAEFKAVFFVERTCVSCSIRRMETVDCQGFQLSRYAAELVEREGIDVASIKRMLELSPRERIEYSQRAANAGLKTIEFEKRMRDEE